MSALTLAELDEMQARIDNLKLMGTTQHDIERGCTMALHEMPRLIAAARAGLEARELMAAAESLAEAASAVVNYTGNEDDIIGSQWSLLIARLEIARGDVVDVMERAATADRSAPTEAEAMFAESNAAYAALRADPAAWAAELAERRVWDVTLADGLDDEDAEATVDPTAALALARAALARAEACWPEWKIASNKTEIVASAPHGGGYVVADTNFWERVPRQQEIDDATFICASRADVPALAVAIESLCAENARLRELGNALSFEAHEVTESWGEGHVCGMIELSLAYRAWDAATAAATATEGK